MAAQRKLTKPPAREALIDIRFEPRVSMDDVQKFVVSVDQKKFEKRSAIWEAMVGVKVGEGVPETSSTQSPVGCRLDDAGHPAHVMQCRLGSFTFSRLSPYGEWEDFSE